ncbi:MAG: DUF1926 domain-containing protein, partial [Fuerstiella sp.]|nr:DUF1926 domain-containing protein [Fuerstiella sp.]
DLDRKIVYDHWPRKSLVDHFLQPDLSVEAFQQGDGLVSGFAKSTYEAAVSAEDAKITLELHGKGSVSGFDVEIRKAIEISKDRPNELLIQYQLHNLPESVPLHFGVEFNFATMPGGASDRYFYDAAGTQLGTLDSQQNLKGSERVGLVDEWQGLDVSIESSTVADIWAFPVETISQSESGFELIH